MNSLISNDAHLKLAWGEETEEVKTSEQSVRIGAAIKKILNEEQAQAKTALSDWSRRYPVSIIGGGTLNVGVLALEGAAAFTTSPVLSNVLSGVGLLGGVVNLGEGILALKEGLNAWKVGDKALSIRLLLQGMLNSSLGIAMMILSVAQFASLSNITAFFDENAFVLPTLFFGLAIFWFVEIIHRLAPVLKGTDLGTRLELPKLQKILENPNQQEWIAEAKKWVYEKLQESDETKIQDKLNETKAEIGFLSAMETFRLFEMILEEKDKVKILDQINKVGSQISTWNRMLYLKLASVILSSVGFGVGMGAIAAKSEAMDGAQNIAMSVAGCVPLYLDIQRPFEREIPIVITRS